GPSVGPAALAVAAQALDSAATRARAARRLVSRRCTGTSIAWVVVLGCPSSTTGVRSVMAPSGWTSAGRWEWRLAGRTFGGGVPGEMVREDTTSGPWVRSGGPNRG